MADAVGVLFAEGAVGEELDAFLDEPSPYRFAVVMHSPDYVEVNNNAKYYIHIHFVDPIDHCTKVSLYQRAAFHFCYKFAYKNNISSISEVLASLSQNCDPVHFLRANLTVPIRHEEKLPTSSH